MGQSHQRFNRLKAIKFKLLIMETIKDIKPYLPLYYGCDCMIGDLNWKREKYTYGLAPGVDLDYGKPIKSKLDAHVLSVFSHKTTLILRPLSGMTEEEKIEFKKLIPWIDFIRFSDNRFEYYEHVELNKHETRRTCTTSVGIGTLPLACVPWLLSKGFDLFKLIPEGLAIDSTKCRW